MRAPCYARMGSTNSGAFTTGEFLPMEGPRLKLISSPYSDSWRLWGTRVCI